MPSRPNWIRVTIDGNLFDTLFLRRTETGIRVTLQTRLLSILITKMFFSSRKIDKIQCTRTIEMDFGGAKIRRIKRSIYSQMLSDASKLNCVSSSFPRCRFSSPAPLPKIHFWLDAPNAAAATLTNMLLSSCWMVMAHVTISISSAESAWVRHKSEIYKIRFECLRSDSICKLKLPSELLSSSVTQHVSIRSQLQSDFYGILFETHCRRRRRCRRR